MVAPYYKKCKLLLLLRKIKDALHDSDSYVARNVSLQHSYVSLKHMKHERQNGLF